MPVPATLVAPPLPKPVVVRRRDVGCGKGAVPVHQPLFKPYVVVQGQLLVLHSGNAAAVTRQRANTARLRNQKDGLHKLAIAPPKMFGGLAKESQARARQQPLLLKAAAMPNDVLPDILVYVTQPRQHPPLLVRPRVKSQKAA